MTQREIIKQMLKVTVVDSKEKALNIADMLLGNMMAFPQKTMSEQAGYDVRYRLYEDGEIDWENYANDLGNRIEVNFKDGEVINIWITYPEEPKKELVTIPQFIPNIKAYNCFFGM